MTEDGGDAVRHDPGLRLAAGPCLQAIVVLALTVAGCGDGPTAPDLPVGTILRFTTPPTNAVVDRTVPVSVVELQGTAGVRVEPDQAQVVVHILDGPPGARLEGDTVVDMRFGIARFEDLRVAGATGSVSLKATVRGTDVSAFSQPFHVVPAPDVILLQNATSDTARLLVDGQGADGFDNDVEIRSPSDQPIEVILDHAHESNEVVVFQKGRAPTILPDVPWTSGVDTVIVRLRDPVHLALAVWVVAGDFAVKADAARSELKAAQEILDENSAGIILDPEIIDATTNPRAQDFAYYSITAPGDEHEIEDAIGYRADEVNAYVVDDVNVAGGHESGVALPGSGFIAIGGLGNVGEEIVWVHELGHTFGLAHALGFNGAPWTNRNIMVNGSPLPPGETATDLTEGQIFRIHFDEESSLHQVYGLNPVGLRLCRNQDRTPSCPWIALNLP